MSVPIQPIPMWEQTLTLLGVIMTGVIVVCGGKGSLHAVCLPSWGESHLQSRAVNR